MEDIPDHSLNEHDESSLVEVSLYFTSGMLKRLGLAAAESDDTESQA